MATLNDTLTQQLRNVRTQKAISIESIAEQLGISPEGYVKIENGETPITLDRVENMAKALKTTIPELLSLPATIIGHANANAEMSYALANSSPNSNTMHIGVSSDVLEKLFKRIDELEDEVKVLRKQR